MRAEAGPYIAKEIAEACRGSIVNGDPATSFSGISTDSRDIKEGDLFVPLTGANFNGHKFVLPALRAGARGSFVHREAIREILHNLTDRVLIQVQDTLHTLSDLASAHRDNHPIPLIAVTGSSGKTTVKEMIAAVLGRSHRPLVSQANLNNTIGLPMTVLKLNSAHTAAVVEAGINMNGEMELLAHAARPDVAVITTVGPVHLEGLGSVENVAREKFRLVKGLRRGGTAALPEGDPYIEALRKEVSERVVTFGYDRGDYRAENVRMGTETTFDMITPDGTRTMRLNSVGRHAVTNALAAAAAVSAIGVDMETIADALEEFAPPSWRGEIVRFGREQVLFRDCYNANPQSVAAALETLALYNQRGRTLALLADMLELGADADRLHHETGALAARLGIDRVIFVGEFARAFEEGFLNAGGANEAVDGVDTKDDAWGLIGDETESYAAILVKGSRRMKMETLAERILEE